MFGSIQQRFIVTAIVLGLFAAPLAAQEWAGVARVQGVVKGEDGEGIEGAMVTLLKDGREGDGPEPFPTEKKGRWSYLGLADGNWTVIIEMDGMVPSEGTIRLSQFSRHPPVVVTLRPIPENRGQIALGLLSEGDELLKGQDYAGARAKYEESLEKLEADTMDLAYDRISRTYAGEGDNEQAIAYIDRALQTKPGDANLLRFKAQLLDQVGRSSESITMLEELHQMSPDDTATLQVLIDLLARSDREDEAQAYMAKLPESEKLSPDLLLNLGIDAYNEGAYGQALENFGRAVAENPERADVYWYRGLVYLAQQNNDLAIADFEKLLELAPDHPSAEEAKQFLDYLKSN